LLLFLAGIFILAHSFIPHTHHKDHICIINSPCYNQQALLHSNAVHTVNSAGHYHAGIVNVNLQHSGENNTDNNHQTSEWEVRDDHSCNENVRRIGDSDSDEKRVDDTPLNSKPGDHSLGNEASCRYILHTPFQEENHTHDGHCQTDGCALFEVLVYDPLARKPVIECACSENDHHHSDLAQALLQMGYNPPAGWYNLPFRQKPYTDTYSGFNHSLIPGLRAPPSC
jgi:hypothetical protein